MARHSLVPSRLGHKLGHDDEQNRAKKTDSIRRKLMETKRG